MILSDFKYYLKKHGFLTTFFNLGFWSIIVYRLGNYMWSCKHNVFKITLLWYAYLIVKNILILISKIELPPSVIIGKNLNLVHAYGLVMGDKVIVGNNVTIGPWVVIGHNGDKNLQPIIMDNVYVGSKSTILGGIMVGKNSLISANCLLSKSIPNNSIVKPAFSQILFMNNENIKFN